MQDCETNDCRKEKRGCEGCYYNKESLIKDIDKALRNFKNEKVEITYCYSKFCENKCYKHIDNKKENN